VEDMNSPTNALKHLMELRNGFIIHQGVCTVARLGVADLLEQDVCTTEELARRLVVNEDALYRTLRALAGHGIFEEISARTFKNSGLSLLMRTGVPGSIRPALLLFATELWYGSFGTLLNSIQTGEPASAKLFGMGLWEYMRQNPDLASIFDAAMMTFSSLQAPAVADAYDFGAWESIMDVGGGIGIMLSQILTTHKGVRGVLADQPHVLERARQRGLLGGDLTGRTSMVNCDFFKEVPTGCQAYLLKHVIHDWDDERSRVILANCRRSIQSNGVLLLVEWNLAEANLASTGKLTDLVMLTIAGGKERTGDEYRKLLESEGFHCNRIIPTATEVAIIEAFPE
jgi:hypothetical protein